MRGAPLLIALLGAAVCAAAPAHPQDEAPPQVWLDKPAQYRAGIRTLPVTASLPPLRLPALVVSDPRRELRIAATQDGIVEAVGGALPVPGQAVHAGQVLARLRPVLTRPEHSDLDVDLTVAKRDVKQGLIQINRYAINENQHLDVKLSTPTVEIITKYHSSLIRRAQLSEALDQPLTLVAPRDGTILRSPAAAGKVAAAGQVLFEIDAAGTLAVEAEYADEDIDADAVERALTDDGRSVPLRFLGLGYDSALRSHRALYDVAAADAGLSVNQPLLLDAPREEQGPPSYSLPESAVFTRGGHSWVWLHQDPRRFEMRQVTLRQGGDSGKVMIGAGLRPGERVVAAGLDALNAAARAQQGQP